MLPPTLPLFPLPTVVLFPNVFLPLHIFEPRYRQMVQEALDGDRLIGMVLLKPGFEAEYDGQPPVYDVGCAGLITHAEKAPDGRYNIVLRGLGKFRVDAEQPPDGRTQYRVARVTPIDEPSADADRERLRTERRRLEAMLSPVFEGPLSENQLPQAMADEDLVNALSQYLELEPIEKQALLERNGPLARARALLELIEMKALLDRNAGSPGTIH
jgi:Lon protease-like protein